MQIIWLNVGEIKSKWYNLALMGTTTPGLAKKLGIKPGMRVCLLDAPAEAEQAIREAAPWAIFSTRLDEARAARAARYDVILFWPRQLEGLVNLFADLQRRIVPDGSIWAVIPKQKFAARRGLAFNWEQMQATGLQTDLVDNKVASVTEQDYGTRFVIRKERRGRL